MKLAKSSMGAKKYNTMREAEHALDGVTLRYADGIFQSIKANCCVVKFRKIELLNRMSQKRHCDGIAEFRS